MPRYDPKVPNQRTAKINRTHKELEELAITLTAQWLATLLLLQRNGRYQYKTLERGALELLRIVYPTENLIDANDIIPNHAVVDILSSNKKFGIQVKLTLDPGIVREVREAWKKELGPNGLFAGANRLWILGADLSAKSPNPNAGPWQQVKNMEWALLSEKLDLTHRSTAELDQICAVLAKHLHLPAAHVSLEDAIDDIYRTLKSVLGSLKEITLGRFIEYIPTMPEVEPLVNRAGIAALDLESAVPLIQDVVEDRALRNSVKSLLETIGSFTENYDLAMEFWYGRLQPYKRGNLANFDDPEGESLRSEYVTYLSKMEASHEAAVSRAADLVAWFERNHEEICLPQLR